MTFDKDPMRWLLALMIFFTMGALALVVFAVCEAFHPGDRLELVNPAGASHRAFTDTPGWVGTITYLRASDWPRTFLRPALLGRTSYPDRWSSRDVIWSVDGSVIAIRSQPEKAAPPVFNAAYDYREHILIRSSLNDYEMDRRITDLMNTRGGVGAVVQEASDIKGGNRKSFPAWILFASFGLFILGGEIALRIVRGRKAR